MLSRRSGIDGAQKDATMSKQRDRLRQANIVRQASLARQRRRSSAGAAGADRPLAVDAPSTREHSWGTFAWLVAGGLVYTALVVLSYFPGDFATAASYRSAAPCKAGEADTDCLTSWRGYVTDFRDESGKGAQDWVEVADVVDSTRPPQRIGLIGWQPVLNHIAVGNGVTVTSWRGRWISVSADGRVQRADSTPNLAPPMEVGGSAALLLGAVAAALGALRLRSDSDSPWRDDMHMAAMVLALLAAALAVCTGAICGFSFGAPGSVMVTMTAVLLEVALTAGVWWLIRRWYRRPVGAAVAQPARPRPMAHR
jgi:hypothetical protein